MNANSKLLLCVVRRGRGDRVVSIAKNAGAKGSSVLFGRGTAHNKILRILCLADTEKEVVFTIAADQELFPIIEALRTAPDLCQKAPGIGIVLNVTAFFHASNNSSTNGVALASQENDCVMEKEHKLVCAIVNAGLADDLMHAAREAGATGGTIFRARGTGTEADSAFFGITIVPEKEMLMILTQSGQAARIVSAIKESPCLAEPGVGIVFTMPVEDFFPLGLKNNACRQ